MNSQNPEIIIHIGAHKTGTTSLQYFLFMNRDLLLNSGILYPKTGIPEKHNLYGQHQIAWVLMENECYKDADIWIRLEEEFKRETPVKIVMSSEDFNNLGKSAIKKLKDELHSDNLKIVLYLRSYLAFMKSSYFESVKKNKFSGSFKDFIIQRYSRIDYSRNIEKWSSIFGEDKISLRLYDEIVFNKGLIKDFCGFINFDVSNIPDNPEIRKNIAPNEKTVNAIRNLNRLEKLLSHLSINWTGIKRMREVFSNPKIRQSFGEKLFLSLTGSRFCLKRDLKLLHNIVSEMDQSLLLSKIGEEGMKILYKGLY